MTDMPDVKEPSKLEELIQFYEREVKYLIGIVRTPYGDDALTAYRKFLKQLETVRADLAPAVFTKGEAVDKLLRPISEVTNIPVASVLLWDSKKRRLANKSTLDVLSDKDGRFTHFIYPETLGEPDDRH